MLTVTKAKNLPKDRPRKTVQNLGPYLFAIPDIEKKKNNVLMALISPVAAIIIGIPLFFGLAFVMMLGPKFLKKALVTRMIPFMMSHVEQRTKNQRVLLLQHVQGRVLDVGAGGGAYIPLLKGKAAHIVALEPVASLHDRIRETARENGFQNYQISVHEHTIEEYASQYPNASASFDWVILGNVLCEVDNPQEALRHISSLLKPGGYVYFSEHLGSPVGTTTRMMQDFVNPIWNLVSHGCNCNHDSLEAIEGMEQWDVISWEMSGIRVFGGPFVMGVARKVDTSV